MMKRSLMCCVLAALLLAVALPVMGEEDTQSASLGDAITKGTPLFSLRYRFEEVDQTGVDKKAHASTLRTTVGYRTGTHKGLSFTVEAEDVSVVGDAQAYNNKGFEHLWNGVTDRPVVADPANTSLNQAYLQWKNSANKAHYGRREIIIGDARFVGNVGWRQNHQSFDAFAFTNSSLDFVDISYRFVNKVHTITGATNDMASHLINLDLDVGQAGKLGLYGYLLDFTRMQNYGQSRSTYGAELKGKQQLSDSTALLYELEYAAQADNGDNPNTVEATYLFLTVGAAFKPVTIKVGYEVLGGDADEDMAKNKGAFTTPLATLHKFNGWADKFLGTPGAGLEDLYFLATGMIGPVKGLGVYHMFKTADGGADLGSEFDLQFTYKAPWKQTFGLKGAFYSTDATEAVSGVAHTVDTKKFWVFTGFKI
jgi:hypothetical protein